MANNISDRDFEELKKARNQIEGASKILHDIARNSDAQSSAVLSGLATKAHDMISGGLWTLRRICDV